MFIVIPIIKYEIGNYTVLVIFTMLMTRLLMMTAIENDDIYIMMKCLSVCLFVTKNEHFLVGFHGFQDSFRVFHGFSR